MAQGACVNSEASPRDRVTVVVVTDHHWDPGQIGSQLTTALGVGRSPGWALPDS